MQATTKSAQKRAPSASAKVGNESTPELTAKNLKNALWETLNAVKNDDMHAGQADAIASQAREILRATNTQLRIASQSKRPVATDVIKFAED